MRRIPKYYFDFREKINRLLVDHYHMSIENVPCVKREKISHSPVAFYNKSKMYFDESSLPLACTDISDLSNQNVLYGIFCKGKFYIGSTTDFGERISTHIKDAKKYKKKKLQRLYADMVQTGECLAFVFATTDTEQDLRRLEHIVIRECKKYSIDKACNFDENAIFFINEGIDDSKEYANKFCYNIVN